jgi:hypothetical protein
VATPISAVLPDPDKMLRDKGHRLHLSYDGECHYVDIAEERVWPDKILDPEANAVLDVTDRIILHRDGIRWMRDLLDEVLKRMDADDRAAGEGAPT